MLIDAASGWWRRPPGARACWRETRYDLALNFGVCGSFDRALAPGTVVQVVTDRIAELGAEDGEAFLTIHELICPAKTIVHRRPAVNARRRRTRRWAGFPAVSGITVNTVHGNERSIAAVTERFKPQVESMEGAAFM